MNVKEKPQTEWFWYENSQIYDLKAPCIILSVKQL